MIQSTVLVFSYGTIVAMLVLLLSGDDRDLTILSLIKSVMMLLGGIVMLGMWMYLIYGVASAVINILMYLSSLV